MRRYLTTAIDYPNAPPHVGHVLEKVLADSVARWWRLSGDEVRFQIGTDEHGVKIQRTAEKEGVTPQQLVDRNVPLFRASYDDLQISYDHFIRTGDRKEHWPTVEVLWRKLQEAGTLEKRTYTGLYCSGCEKFMTQKDLVDGKCPNHFTMPESVHEENWFFLLSRETSWLKELLKTSYRILPEFRARETLSLLDQGLEDVSFSRPRSSLSWGVPVPGDSDQVMYVWCDALTNYISGLGFFTDHEEREWWDHAEVTHVIGKDIARFHALIWPAMLKAAGVRTPDRLLIHGFLTSEGQKMSKSLGNVVDPQEIIAKYGVDALRFYLSHEIPVGNDGDFSWKRFREIYDAKLRNDMGNLLNRVLVLLQKDGGVLQFAEKMDQRMECDWVDGFWRQYVDAMNDFRMDMALHSSMALVSDLNQLIDRQKPWANTSAKRRQCDLTTCAEFLRHITLALLPFMPQTAQNMARQLGLPYAEKMLDRDFVIAQTMKEWGGEKGWKKVGEPAILFPPVP